MLALMRININIIIFFGRFAPNVRQYMTAGTPAVPEGRNDRQGVQIYCLLSEVLGQII